MYIMSNRNNSSDPVGIIPMSSLWVCPICQRAVTRFCIASINHRTATQRLRDDINCPNNPDHAKWRKAPLVDGAVVIDRGTIIAVGPSSRLLAKYPGHALRKLHNAVLMPGLINVHTHLELPPLLRSIRARTFPDWVLNLIKAKRSLRDQDYHTAATQNIRSVIESGTTCVGEICTHAASPGIIKRSHLRARDLP